MKTIWLYGDGGHAHVVTEAASAAGLEIAGLFDDDISRVESSSGRVSPGIRLAGNCFAVPNVPLVITVGNNRIREGLAQDLNADFISLVHPSATCSPSARLGVGTVILHKAVVQANTTIGHHAIVNTSASIDHDNQIGDFCHVSPNATLCGDVHLGTGAWVGAAAVILPGIRIGKWSTVGAGAVVHRNVPDYSTAVGNPARVIKTVVPTSPSSSDSQLQLMAGLSGIIAKVVEASGRPMIDPVTRSSRLQKDLGLDSLELAELTVRIEAEYGVDVFAKGVVRTVGEILDQLP